MKALKLSSSVKFIAFIGYLAHGFIYLLVGGFALLLALGNSSGAATNQKGAVKALLGQPFGELVLWILTGGLFCYSIWRLLESLLDYDDLGTDLKALVLRAGYLLSGVLHAFLGVYTIKLIFSLSQDPGQGAEKNLASTLLHQPFGVALTAAVGIGIIVFGVFQIVKAIREKFVKKMKVPAGKMKFVLPLCKVGLIARGSVFILIGAFFIQAAFKHDSREAGGLREAWTALRNQPFGDVLLAIVAIGFIAFAMYAFTRAFFHLEHEHK